jgi:glycosyltransferase involved in cell wall biosynthesis
MLERRAGELGVGDRVRFAGAAPHDDLAAWYRAADLTVLSSHSEGVPNVLLESLACGTPFVATAVGSVASLTTNLAVLAPPGDPAALAGAIHRALTARPRVEDYLIPPGQEAAATAVLTAVEEAMARRGSR